MAAGCSAGARRAAPRRRPGRRRGARPATPLAWPVVVALLTLGGVVAALVLLDTTTTTSVTLTSDLLALLGLAVLAAACLAGAAGPRPATLRPGRRSAAALLWLLLFYPNLSGLPMPADLATLYQGLLPTWNWDFQFAVNTDPAVVGGVVDAGTLVRRRGDGRLRHRRRAARRALGWRDRGVADPAPARAVGRRTPGPPGPAGLAARLAARTALAARPRRPAPRAARPRPRRRWRLRSSRTRGPASAGPARSLRDVGAEAGRQGCRRPRGGG